jgi:hypothetical protein
VTCSAATFAALSSRRLRGVAQLSKGLKYIGWERRRSEVPDSVAINGQGERTILRATQAFQPLRFIFLQLKKVSRYTHNVSIYRASRTPSSANRAFSNTCGDICFPVPPGVDATALANGSHGAQYAKAQLLYANSSVRSLIEQI